MKPDAAFASLTEEIQAAREGLLQVVRRDRDRRWHPYELQLEARNGWSASAVGLALDGLLQDGLLVLTDDGLIVAAE